MARNLDYYRGRPVVSEIMGLSKVRRMPRLGKIHLGIKVPSAKNESCRKKNHPDEPMCPYCSYPKDTDYFVFPKDADPRIRAKVVEVYGETPTQLDVFLPTNNREQFFPQSLAWYKASRLMCRGDGQSAMRVDEASGAMKTMDCPCEHFTREDRPDCKLCGRLMVMLPKVSMAGVWQIDTGSSNNIIAINSACEYYLGLLHRLAFVPFLLKRVPTKITDPAGKIITKALLQLEFEGDAVQVAAFRTRDAIAALGPAAAALPPPPAGDFTDPEPDDPPDGVTFDRQPLPDNVDSATGEVKETTGGPSPGAPPEREPGADEALDGKATVTEPPPKDTSGIPSYLTKATDKEQLDLRWAAVQPLIEGKPKPIQKGMETVYEDRKEELPF